jgi:hypothetical protein
VERDLFVRADPVAAAAAGALADPTGVAMGIRGNPPATGRCEAVAAIGAIALLGLDVTAMLLERLRRRGGRGALRRG